MKIGTIQLANPIILAPMAGVTDLPFRLLVKEMGCGLVYSEMVSHKGLLYNNANTVSIMQIEEQERPVSVQLFGSNPQDMAAAAKLIERAGADIIDINMGCPAPKIIKNGEGSALMREPQLAYEIMCRVVEAVDVPVSVKMRKGWDAAHVNVLDMAAAAEKAGIAAIAVHGRTREQFYAGQADWEIIKAVKAAVHIPVIGNGDVRSPQDAKRLMAETGCDGVMIGRAAQGNPWLFKQAIHYLETGELLAPPSWQERLDMLYRHLDMLITYKGEYVGVREMRKHAAWYTKGLAHSAELRMRFNQADSKAGFLEILQQYK